MRTHNPFLRFRLNVSIPYFTLLSAGYPHEFPCSPRYPYAPPRVVEKPSEQNGCLKHVRQMHKTVRAPSRFPPRAHRASAIEPKSPRTTLAPGCLVRGSNRKQKHDHRSSSSRMTAPWQISCLTNAKPRRSPTRGRALSRPGLFSNSRRRSWRLHRNHVHRATRLSQNRETQNCG